MKRFLFVFLFLFILVFIFVPYSTINASVVLNEVAIQPNQGVELYNNSSTSMDISGWYIDDAGGATYYTIPQQTILAPLSCYVFTADFNLNKASADVVRLFDSSYPPTTSSAQLMESYSYPKAPDAGYSFAKKIDGGNEWQTSSSSLGLFNESLTSCIPSPTPTPLPTETPIPTETPTPFPNPTSPAESKSEGGTPTPSEFSNIFISEVFPYPNPSEHEWIELYNGNNNAVNLTNWYIDDGENTGSTPKLFSLSIESNSYATVEISSSLFNNAGDTARVLNSAKSEKDSMEYGTISQGKSIGRISFTEDIYCEQEPSKNTTNNSCIVAEPTKEQTKLVTQLGIVPTTQKPPTTTRQTTSIYPQKQIFISNNVPNTKPIEAISEVLGIQTERPIQISPIPYLSSVSFSYSLLTIVSIFIKMKNA